MLFTVVQDLLRRPVALCPASVCKKHLEYQQETQVKMWKSEWQKGCDMQILQFGTL